MNKALLHLAKAREKERKLDAHRKIQFGGLVIKSGMDKFSKSVILGALIEAFQNIENDKNYQNLYKIKGEAGFLKE